MFFLISSLKLLLDKSSRLKLTLIFFGIIFQTILETAGIGIFLPMIIFVVEGKDIFLQNDLIKNYPLINFYFENNKNETILLHSFLLILLLYFFKFIYLTLFSWVKEKFLFNLKSKISSNLFLFYLKKHYKDFYKENRSTYISLILNKVGVTVESISSLIFFVSEIFIFVFIFILLFIIEPKGSIVVLIILSIIFLVILLITKKIINKWRQIKVEKENLQIKNLNEGFSLFKYLKVLNLENIYSEKFKFNNYQVNHAAKIQVFLGYVPRLSFEFFSLAGITLLALFLINDGYDKTTFIPKISIFVLAAVRFMPSVNKILHSYQTIKFSKPAIKLLKDELTLIDNKSILDKVNYSTLSDYIELKNLNFSYGDKNIFKNLNFKIKKNEIVGLIGKTGSGKSTLIDIIMGISRIENGSVFCDGKDFTKKSLYNYLKISYVPQQIFLIDDTIQRNIILGKGQIDSQKFKRVIKISMLEDFINTLPGKENTLIGENGVKISGGQKQRIAIARALYQDSSLIILDEATNALDLNTEKELFRSLLDYHNNITIIIVTHRESILNFCKKVYKVDQNQLNLEIVK